MQPLEGLSLKAPGEPLLLLRHQQEDGEIEAGPHSRTWGPADSWALHLVSPKPNSGRRLKPAGQWCGGGEPFTTTS